ncbi:MAG TPA: hypothetical protein VNL14_21295 [Candidatus Acidoferrales bacterium]|nr:hypothetical protein [Candidatus Acidoferrales bacterium]
MNNEAGLSVEEKVASLFQQDTLLPAQYFDTFRRKSYLEPEKRLMLAVLEDAIACFQKYALARDPRGKALFADAQEWIFASDHDWLFSFENVCEMLGFNPKYLREGLTRWKERQLAARPRAKVYRFAPRKSRKKPAFVAARKHGHRRLKAANR